MEESEKRKERLNAMRMEAFQAGSYVDSESPRSASGALSNPLIENETAGASSHQYNLPRFDYYTDPMAAFSGNKRRNDMSPQVSQGHYNTPSRPFYRSTIPNSAYNYYPPMTPAGQGTLNPPRNQFNHSPFMGPMDAASPLNRAHHNPPTSWAGPGGVAHSSHHYHSRPNLSRGSNFTNPSLRPMNSPRHDSGHGRGWGLSSSFSMSPGSGPSVSRRGVGQRDSISADQRPDSYYSKEMVEDPWLSLSPVIWKGGEIYACDSDKSWLPKSIAVKKSKASLGAPQTSISQQSLAEYLAATFNDSTD